MKKEYQKPDYEIILLNEENVITSSGAWDTPDEPMYLQNPMSDTVWE